MQVQQQPNAVSARQGHVDSQRIWRLPVLKDRKVFLRSEEENNPGFTVDLLLYGSASRLHCQATCLLYTSQSEFVRTLRKPFVDAVKAYGLVKPSDKVADVYKRQCQQ